MWIWNLIEELRPELGRLERSSWGVCVAVDTFISAADTNSAMEASELECA